MHPTIRLAKNFSKFCWLKVSIAEGIRETDLYVKPTDSH